jgi:hypothetical protein
MQQSLLNRFRGAFLGMAIGEMLGAQSQHGTPIHSLSIGRSLSNKLHPETPPSAEISSMEITQIAVNLSRSLIQKSSLEVRDAETAETPFTSAALAIAALPLALSLHENLAQLQQSIQQIAAERQLSPLASMGALIVGGSVSLILREQPDLAEFIPILIADLALAASDPITESLGQLHELIQHRSGMAIAIPNLSAQASAQSAAELAPILLALYCYLSTPEHVQLTLLRAAHTPFPKITCAIAGFLSGSQNGLAGLPLRWRQAVHSVDPVVSAGWGMANATELLDLAEQLWAVWAGVYRVAPDCSYRVAAIAAPDIIRPR